MQVTLLTSKNWAGGGGLNLQPGQKTIFKRNGIAERTSVFLSDSDPGLPFQPLVTPYPDQNTGGYVCDTCQVEGPNDGGFWKTTAVWVSIWTPGTSYVTLESKTIQIPVDQSPNFFNMAGSPGNPFNGALFDANGVFIGFGPGSQFQGVVSVFTTQQLLTVRSSGSAPAKVDPGLFVESVSNTIRGAIWESEIVYNLSISIVTGLPTF